MILQTKHFDKSEELITELENLYKQRDYVFRGHFDEKYILQPSAFRKETRQKYNEAFPVKQEYISNEWLKSKKLSKKVRSILRIEDHFYSRIYDVCQQNSRSTDHGIHYSSLTYQSPHYPIDRTIEWVIFIMQHNYSLTTNTTDKEPWKSDDTFFRMLGEFLESIKVILLKNGDRWQAQYPIEEITNFTEAELLFQQHYGKATKILDWTMNPYVAIYFAVDPSNESFNSQTGLFEAIKLPPNNLSIYALKRGILKEERIETNKRAKAQNAIGIICEKPFSFYLHKGKFISMEDCIEKESPKLEIIKYTLHRSTENIKKLNSFLKTHNINKYSLLLD